MNIKQTVVALSLIVAGFAPAFMVAQPAFADAPKPTCVVLPQSVCDHAQGGDLKSNGIWDLILLILNILTAGIGIVAVGALGWAGFLYASAGDDSGKVKQSKEMIRNTIIGIVAYGLMYVGLQFLIPGGVF